RPGGRAGARRAGRRGTTEESRRGGRVHSLPAGDGDSVQPGPRSETVGRRIGDDRTVTPGGSGGIRTHERVAPLPVFKTGAFNRSATLPSFSGRPDAGQPCPRTARGRKS